MSELESKLDANISSSQILRAYAWAILKKNMDTVWTEENYGGLIPIVPVSEEKELDAYTGPHIVYGYAEAATTNSYSKQGSMTFAIYDDNFWRLTETVNTLSTVFSGDDAAERVNRFSSNREFFIGMRFGFVEIGFVEGGTPETEEGGRQSALVNIRYEYFVTYNIDVNVE